MFANTKFTKKHAPLFMDKSRFTGEEQVAFSALKPYILNDGAEPPQTLIALDIFTIPQEDLKTPKHKTICYDLDGFVCLTT